MPKQVTRRYSDGVKLRDIGEIADYYAARDMAGAPLAWGAETAHGQKSLGNYPTLSPSYTPSYTVADGWQAVFVT